MVETTNKGHGVLFVPKAKQTVCHRGIVSSQNPAFHLAIKVVYFVGHKVPRQGGVILWDEPHKKSLFAKIRKFFD